MPPLPPGSAILAIVVPLLLFLVPLFSLIFFIAYRTYRGRNWARWTLTALYLIGGIKYTGTLARSLREVPLIGVLDGIMACCQIAAFVLLFVPDANRWYRTRARHGSAA
jgi:hypothetical protein